MSIALKVKNAFIEDLWVERSSFFLITPIFIAAGVLLYFGKFENSLHWSLLLIILAVSSILCIKYRYCFFMIALIASGYAAPYIKERALSNQMLKGAINDAWVEGTIVEIKENEGGHRILIDTIYSEKEGGINNLKYIRFNTKSAVCHLDSGDKIRVLLNLMEPPGATLPNGFNFASFALFKEIGAIGYAKSKIFLLHKQDLGIFDIKKAINKTRMNIKNHIYNSVDKQQASIITALLIGDTSGISKDDIGSIRISGIAHIMAISGMHIMIVIGCVFFAVRRLIVAIFPIFASYYDVRKIAAYFAIIFSFGYLLIAGYPVSAQRAFFMAFIALLAILLDRDNDVFRAIALACNVILLAFPESILSPSFQMSFAAALSLIAAFGFVRSYFAKNAISFQKYKILIYFLGTTFSSFIAATATTPFVLYHFNQFSVYSLLTNLVAVPLTNFAIMPLIIVATLLIPFNLHDYIFAIVGFFIKIMLFVAHYISNLENASIYIPSMQPMSLCIFSLGFVILCVLQTKIRIIGIGLIVFSLFMPLEQRPDIMIEKSGNLFAIKLRNEYYFSNLMQNRFVRKSWEQKYGISKKQKINALQECTDGVCHFHNYTIITKNNRAYYDENNFIIDLSDNPLPYSHINLEILKKYGNIFVYIKNNVFTIKSANNQLIKRVS